MKHLTLIHIVLGFRASAALYVIVLNAFLPLRRIPIRQPYSSTFCVIRSIFELH